MLINGRQRSLPLSTAFVHPTRSELHSFRRRIDPKSISGSFVWVLKRLSTCGWGRLSVPNHIKDFQHSAVLLPPRDPSIENTLPKLSFKQWNDSGAPSAVCDMVSMPSSINELQHTLFVICWYSPLLHLGLYPKFTIYVIAAVWNELKI